MSKRPRRNHGLQGEGGACCHQGRSNTGLVCGAVRRSPQSDYIVEVQLEEGQPTCSVPVGAAEPRSRPST